MSEQITIKGLFRLLIASLPVIAFLNGFPLVVILCVPLLYYVMSVTLMSDGDYATMISRAIPAALVYLIGNIIVLRIILYFAPEFISTIKYTL